MLPIIQALWIGRPLSQLEKLCVRSFLHHGHEFHLYVYDDVPGIPGGAEVKDANEILPESEIFRLKEGNYIAPFSDWFRYALLAKRGNFWVDMDTVCVSPFDFPEEIVFGASYDGYPPGVLKFPIGHPCVLAMEKSCRNYGEEMPWDDAADKKAKQKIRRRGADKSAAGYLAFGSVPVFTKAVRHFALEKYAKPFMCFYSINHFSRMHVFDRSFAGGARLYPDTYALHISNANMTGIHALDKNADFDADSLFEQLKAKYGVAPAPNARKISEAEVHAIFARSEEAPKIRSRKRRKKRAAQALVLLSAFCAASFVAGWFFG